MCLSNADIKINIDEIKKGGTKKLINSKRKLLPNGKIAAKIFSRYEKGNPRRAFNNGFLGPVVRKPINAHLRLKINQIFVSFIKNVFKG